MTSNISHSRKWFSTVSQQKDMTGKYQLAKKTLAGTDEEISGIFSYAVSIHLGAKIVMMPFMRENCRTVISRLEFTLPMCRIAVSLTTQLTSRQANVEQRSISLTSV